MVADSKGKSDISFAGTFASSAFAACFAEVYFHVKFSCLRFWDRDMMLFID